MAEYQYFSRILDTLLQKQLKVSGAVQIVGPKWCGKTATAKHNSASQVYLQDPDKGPSLIALASVKPSLILEGAEPRLIDEWQMAPQLWDAVRFAVDQSHRRGRFILTGSATPRRDGERPAHSGVGRISKLMMRPMSLQESHESTSQVSLAELFGGNHDIAGIADMDIEDLALAICRGGWPEAVLEKDSKIAQEMAKNYVVELLDADIEQMDGIRRNKTWMRQLMRSYARNTSSEATLTTIQADMRGEMPSLPTVADYIDALTRAFVIEDLEAWNPQLRSKTVVRTSPTRHFIDPSIAAAMLAVTPEKLLSDFETFGLLFESLCVRDLRVYTDALAGRVFHYRDKTGLEADAVLSLDDGRWALVEVKLGAQQIDSAAEHLKKIAQRVNQEKEGAPSFLMVLTGTATAYRRDDGVLVVPLATLSA